MKWNGREEFFIHDIAAMILGILIICISGFVFWNVAQRCYMFPVIFLLGTGLALLKGTKFFKKKKKLPGVLCCAFGLLLVLCAAASFFSMVR